MADAFASVEALVRSGFDAGAFPAATLEVGRADGVIWQHAYGTLTRAPDAPITTTDTIFDLASITKVIATATLMMRAVDDRQLDLDTPVVQHFPECSGKDRESVTLRDLLSHSSGLTAYLPFFRDHTGRVDFERAICTLPLEYLPRSKSIYSDLGFILLGFLLDDVGGRAGAFAAQFTQLAAALTDEPLAFNPPREWRVRTAPTEVDSWRGRLLVGEVHDENAWALGGVAGHAGLFGTAAAVGAFARAALRTIAGEPILASPATMREFITRVDVPDSSRALGWDTMLPTSSCGTRLSPTSIGHTGFTGTSLWIDWERDLYIVLLTNRVNPTRENIALRQWRPQIHDAIADAVF
jgi:CubicO group peptidase (beta-lactamase class C family)